MLHELLAACYCFPDFSTLSRSPQSTCFLPLWLPGSQLANQLIDNGPCTPGKKEQVHSAFVQPQPRHFITLRHTVYHDFLWSGLATIQTFHHSQTHCKPASLRSSLATIPTFHHSRHTVYHDFLRSGLATSSRHFITLRHTVNHDFLRFGLATVQTFHHSRHTVNLPLSDLVQPLHPDISSLQTHCKPASQQVWSSHLPDISSYLETLYTMTSSGLVQPLHPDISSLQTHCKPSSLRSGLATIQTFHHSQTHCKPSSHQVWSRHFIPAHTVNQTVLGFLRSNLDPSDLIKIPH